MTTAKATETDAGPDNVLLTALAPIEPDDRPRRANPAAKKALAYRKDHRIWAKYPHQDRYDWPKKKALRNQTYRRQVDRGLRPALGVVGPEVSDVSFVEPIRRKSKWCACRGAVPLGEWVERRQQKRLSLIGRKILGNFDRERHRTRL